MTSSPGKKPFVKTAELTNKEPYMEPEIRDIKPVSYGVVLYGQSDYAENYPPPDDPEPDL